MVLDIPLWLWVEIIAYVTLVNGKIDHDMAHWISGLNHQKGGLYVHYRAKQMVWLRLRLVYIFCDGVNGWSRLHVCCLVTYHWRTMTLRVYLFCALMGENTRFHHFSVLRLLKKKNILVYFLGQIKIHVPTATYCYSKLSSTPSAGTILKSEWKTSKTLKVVRKDTLGYRVTEDFKLRLSGKAWFTKVTNCWWVKLTIIVILMMITNGELTSLMVR